MTDEEFTKIKGNAFDNILMMIGDTVPTEEEFRDAACRAREGLKIFFPNIKVSDEDYGKIIDYVREKLTVQMLGTETLITSKDDHQSWLHEISSKTDWFFWNRYDKYLRLHKNWSPAIIASLDASSDKILDLLGNPRSPESFERRGLIIGEVQSGKTTNYTAICNKAADVGYNVIIVLTGMLEDLRRQTQERLDLEFAGAKSQVFLSNEVKTVSRYQPIGVANVAKYGGKKRIPQFTSTQRDFSKNILASLNLDIRDLNGTILFVVKKNKNVLENLIDWLEKSIDSGKTQIERSLLLIDDEADNASINTNKEDEDPTTINRCIRGILSKFRQTTYVGITATPFANIFINPDNEEEMLGNDLFPKDFIYALDVPKNYIGPTAIFSDEGNYRDMLVEIEPQDTPDIEKFIPRKHKSNFKVQSLPQSLYEAMNYFLLANAVRDLRGDKKTHRTMLIHVSRFVNVQEQVYRLVNEWLYNVRRDLRNYSALPAEEAERNSEYITELHRVFVKFDFEKLCNMNWKNFLHNHLRKANESVVTGLRNSSGRNSFNYAEHPDGLRVIAIGGNSFSRGLTLEGLCTTYFYRHSQAYDTLMQMGRWFGYRPHYDELCKIWTTLEIMDWYGYITDVSRELREEISIMQNYNMTPKDFGLKVRQHPGTLMITARNKMRTAVPIKRPVGLDKIFLETPRLLNDKNILDENKRLIFEFVDSLKDFQPIEGVRWKNSWSGVPKEKIAGLILNFQTAPWHLAFQSQPIGKYILNKMDDTAWDVFIAEGDGKIFSKMSVGGIPIELKPIVRQVLSKNNQIMISGTKVRVGTLGMTKTGLTIDEIRQAEEDYRAIRGNEKVTNPPDRAYMIYGRKPLLILYVIRPTDKKTGNVPTGVPEILFALGVGFPARSPNVSNSQIKTADYYANVAAMEKFNPEDFYDEDVEE